MKAKNILKIAIAPLALATLVAFTNLPPQGKGNAGGGDKDNKSQGQSPDKGNGKQDRSQAQKDNGKAKSGNDSRGKDNGRGDGRWNDGSGNGGGNDKGAGNKNADRGNGNNKSNGGNGNGNKDKGRGNGNSDFNFKSAGNGNSRNLNGKRDMAINWNLNDFDNRWNPRNSKKVTLCHKPDGDANHGVTISVSENAVEAHRNHGDVIGDCNINYDGWSGDYINSRQNVFNNYEQTWERMSFGEALLQVAAQKLLGLRTNLDRDRSRLSADEIRRREALIYELENNSTALDNQLGHTRQRLDSDVNIIISL